MDAQQTGFSKTSCKTCEGDTDFTTTQWQPQPQLLLDKRGNED